MQPVIIWVVGDNTNVGKTTISAALIRALNDLGKRTLGFKPYAGARLMDVIDLLEEIAAGDGQLVGRDARKLAKASPFMSNDLLEVVNPSWRLSHPMRDASVFVRKGSAAIDQRLFMHTENAKSFWARPDLLKLNQVMRLPTQNLQSIANQTADQMDFDHQAVQASSFQRLLVLKPEIVVCEGAGRLLPTWRGAPPVRHLILISGGALHFYPNMRIQVKQDDGAFRPLTVAAVTSKLAGVKHIMTPIPLASASELDEEMNRFIQPIASACAEVYPMR
jgi:hypothetical protein